MPTGRPAASLFAGGTAQIRTMHRRRVRTRVPLLGFPVHHPAATACPRGT